MDIRYGPGSVFSDTESSGLLASLLLQSGFQHVHKVSPIERITLIDILENHLYTFPSHSNIETIGQTYFPLCSYAVVPCLTVKWGRGWTNYCHNRRMDSIYMT